MPVWEPKTQNFLYWAKVTAAELWVIKFSYCTLVCLQVHVHLLYCIYVCANQVKIQVSKATLGGIPIWIIIVSILIGLLILALVIFVLWKVIQTTQYLQMFKYFLNICSILSLQSQEHVQFAVVFEKNVYFDLLTKTRWEYWYHSYEIH